METLTQNDDTGKNAKVEDGERNRHYTSETEGSTKFQRLVFENLRERICKRGPAHMEACDLKNHLLVLQRVVNTSMSRLHNFVSSPVAAQPQGWKIKADASWR
jgi:hypothetical protein